MKRPASVTVFGILNIVFAGFGVLGIVGTVALLSAGGIANNPVAQIIRDNPGYAMWVKVSLPIGLLATAALMAAGIGLLLLKSWARKLSIAYGIYAIVFGLINLVVSFIFIIGPAFEQAAGKQGPEAGAAIGGAIGGTIGGCVGLIYPILLLVFMTRPKVIAAFQAPAAAPPPNLPPA